MRRATLSDLINGKSAVMAEMALRLEKTFGVSMDLLLRMQAGYDAAQIRGRSAEIDVRRYHADPRPGDRLTPRLDSRAFRETNFPSHDEYCCSFRLQRVLVPLRQAP